jgi:hypothetical protein
MLAADAGARRHNRGRAPLLGDPMDCRRRTDATFASVPPRSRMPRLNGIHQSALALNDFAEGLVIAFRDHAVEHLEHAARAAVERELRQRQVTLAGAGALRDGGPAIDYPQTTHRECGHITVGGVMAFL